MRKTFVGMIMTFALAACVPQYSNPYKMKDYTQVPLLELPVRRVETTSYVSGLERLPHVESMMPMTPEKALRNWALIRLRPTYSTNNKAQFIIEEASMIREEDPKDRFFVLDNYKYTLSYKVALVVEDEEGAVLKTAEASGFVSESQPQNASERERDTLFMNLLGDMENQLDEKLTKEIQQNLIDL